MDQSREHIPLTTQQQAELVALCGELLPQQAQLPPAKEESPLTPTGEGLMFDVIRSFQQVYRTSKELQLQSPSSPSSVASDIETYQQKQATIQPVSLFAPRFVVGSLGVAMMAIMSSAILSGGIGFFGFMAVMMMGFILMGSWKELGKAKTLRNLQRQFLESKIRVETRVISEGLNVTIQNVLVIPQCSRSERKRLQQGPEKTITINEQTIPEAEYETVAEAVVDFQEERNTANTRIRKWETKLEDEQEQYLLRQHQTAQIAQWANELD